MKFVSLMREKASFFLILSILFSSCAARSQFGSFEIVEAKMTSAFDEHRNPTDIRTEFSPDTETIHCWFSWKGRSPDLQITAQWYFASEGFQILAHPLRLTRAADQGIVSLKMPAGKRFPVGSYRLDFTIKNRVIKSVSFNVISPAGRNKWSPTGLPVVP